jgi:hypothetical protein
MGKRNAPILSGQLVHLILRGHRPQTLVQSDDDWRALGICASRMLFWCGGVIFGCRCDKTRIHFALQVARAPIGAMAQHVSAAYAAHLWNRRRWDDGVFNHYVAIPLPDEVFLDDLVMWLHRSAARSTEEPIPGPVFTAEAAYLAPPALPWVNTHRVLHALSAHAPREAYRRYKDQPIAPEVLALLTRPPSARTHRTTPPTLNPDDRPAVDRPRPSIDTIARVVANHCHVSLEDLRSTSRKRSASQAKVIATVLYARNGGKAAAAARFFHRSRSTLTEQAERYRQTQPQIFADAEAALEAHLDAEQ